MPNTQKSDDPAIFSKKSAQHSVTITRIVAHDMLVSEIGTRLVRCHLSIGAPRQA